MKRNIESVVILANSTKAKVYEVLEHLKAYFASMNIGVSVVMLSSSVEDLSLCVPACDLAISLGGDGTVLTSVAILKKHKVPILAVNLGTFGYITDTPLSDVERVFEEYLNGQTGTNSRMMLDTIVQRQGNVVFEASSLNDVTVSASAKAKMAKISMYVNGVHGASLRSDGLILATPTGSTAYSLAAGGPILDDSLDAIIINPICPFAMSVRPIVVNSGSEITLKIPRQSTDVSLTCDGHEAFALKEGDVVTVKQSLDRAVFVTNSGKKFIEVLRDKLGWAGGFNA